MHALISRLFSLKRTTTSKGVQVRERDCLAVGVGCGSKCDDGACVIAWAELAHTLCPALYQHLIGRNWLYKILFIIKAEK